MTCTEFETLIGHEISVEEFRSINYIYTYSCDFQEKQQIADFYLSGGMDAVKEYEEYMDRTQAIWTESPSGEFPGVEPMKKMVAKALAPEPQTEPVDIWDWEFRSFLRDISRVLREVSTAVLMEVTKHAQQMYEDKTLVAMTKTFAGKAVEQIDDRCWEMQSYLGDNRAIPELVDYSVMWMSMIRELGYNV